MYLYLFQNRGHIQMRTTSHAFQIHDHIGLKEKVTRPLHYPGAIKDIFLCCATTWLHTALWRSNLNAIRGHMNLNYSTINFPAHHSVFYLCYQCPSHYKRLCLTFKSLFTKQVTFKSELSSALPAMNSLPHGLLLQKIYKNAMRLTVSVFVHLLCHTLRALYG